MRALISFKKVFCYVVIFLAIIGKVNAQEPVKVYDVAAIFTPNDSINSITPDTISLPSYSAITKMKLTISFKINIPDSVSEVYIKIGKEKDSFDFKNDVLNIIKVNNILNMYSGNNKIHSFKLHSTLYPIIVPINRLEDVVWVSISAKDKLGNISETKYFKIQ